MMLIFGFAGSYLASGLVTLFFGWSVLTLLTRGVF